MHPSGGSFEKSSLCKKSAVSRETVPLKHKHLKIIEKGKMAPILALDCKDDENFNVSVCPHNSFFFVGWEVAGGGRAAVG